MKRTWLVLGVLAMTGLAACGEPLEEDFDSTEGTTLEGVSLDDQGELVFNKSYPPAAGTGVCGSKGSKNKCKTTKTLMDVFKKIPIGNVKFYRQLDPNQRYYVQAMTYEVPRLIGDHNNSKDKIGFQVVHYLSADGAEQSEWAWARNDVEIAWATTQGGVGRDMPILQQALVDEYAGSSPVILLTMLQIHKAASILTKDRYRAFIGVEGGQNDIGRNYVGISGAWDNPQCALCNINKWMAVGVIGLLSWQGLGALGASEAVGVLGTGTIGAAAQDSLSCEKECKSGKCNQDYANCKRDKQNTATQRYKDGTPKECADGLYNCCRQDLASTGYCISDSTGTNANLCQYCRSY